MKLSNGTYNTLKWTIAIVVPALITLITSLGALYKVNPDDIAVVTGTISAIATFGGVVLGVSSYTYNNKEDK